MAEFVETKKEILNTLECLLEKIQTEVDKLEQLPHNKFKPNAEIDYYTSVFKYHTDLKELGESMLISYMALSKKSPNNAN